MLQIHPFNALKNTKKANTISITTKTVISYRSSLRSRKGRHGYFFRLRLVPVASVVHSFSR